MSSRETRHSRALRRVLMTADVVGGVWAYALELCRSLEPHGIEVALATLGARPDGRQKGDVRRLRNVRLFEGRWKLEWMRDPWSDVRASGEWLLELESRFEPDVVHLGGYAHGSLPWKSPCLIVGHSCVVSWFRAVKRRDAPPEWDRYRDEVTSGLRAADLVTAPTRAMLETLERHYGAFRAAPVVPNGRRAAEFPPGRKEPIIFSAGRLWDEAKNLPALDEAAARLWWPVYAAGDSRGPGSGDARFRHLKLLGRLAPREVAEWLGRSSIFALPARYEPFGLGPLEAGLAGCALVLGNIASLREVWGDAALYVDPEDSLELTRTLQALMGDAAFRERMAEKARRQALELTPERTARGYLSIYRRLMAREMTPSLGAEETLPSARRRGEDVLRKGGPL